MKLFGYYGIFCHEIGHSTGGQHKLQLGNLGGNPDGFAWSNNQDSVTYMGNAANSSIDRYSKINTPYGGPQQNAARSMEEDLQEYWQNYYELTTLCLSQEHTVCAGESFSLDGESNNGNEVEISVLSGEITINDPASLTTGVIAESSGEVKVRVRNAADNKPYSREKIVKVTVPRKETERNFVILTGETVTLPDVTVLNDTDDGRTGTYIRQTIASTEIPGKHLYH